ncbi:MAG TPA: PP2C family protein-serine/threonine phosphatase [Candidatus Dormibacteraeota bacterium]|nr:PP2C family protein-serine/threonine phosphatase [Candidatus Dormibacteraeota bacterium]
MTEADVITVTTTTENSRRDSRGIRNTEAALGAQLRWLSLLLVFAATALVAYADHLAEAISLGYLYILPLSFSAILLPRKINFVLIAICVFLHDLVGPPYTYLGVRIFHNFEALVAFTVAVVVIQHFVAERNQLAEKVRRQRDDLVRDLKLAAQVQRLFLPKEKPTLPGFDVAGILISARGVGGDYFDFIPWAADVLEVVVADVAGKGMAAALHMSAIAAAMHLKSDETRDIASIVESINGGEYSLLSEDQFVTLFLGELRSNPRTLKYVNCGHNPAMLLKRSTGEVVWLSASSLPLGIYPTVDSTPRRVDVESGDILLCYTDGLIEAEDSKNEQFGSKRLLDVVRTHANSTAEEIINVIYAAAVQFRGSEFFDDDLTLVIVKSLEGSATRSGDRGNSDGSADSHSQERIRTAL